MNEFQRFTLLVAAYEAGVDADIKANEAAIRKAKQRQRR